MVKSPEIQKYPEGTIEGPEFGGSLGFPLEIASCFELRTCLGCLSVSLILLFMNTSQDTLIYIVNVAILRSHSGG